MFFTAISLASRNGHNDIKFLLINKGADPKYIEKTEILSYLHNRNFGLFIIGLFLTLEILFDIGLHYLFLFQLSGLAYITCIEYYEIQYNETHNDENDNIKEIDLKYTLYSYINLISFIFYNFILTNILYYIFGFIVYIPKVILYFYNFNYFLKFIESKKDMIIEFSQNIKNSENNINKNVFNIFNTENFIKIIIFNNYIIINICYEFNIYIFKLLFEIVNNNIKLINTKIVNISVYNKIKDILYLYSGIAFFKNDINQEKQIFQQEIIKLNIPQIINTEYNENLDNQHDNIKLNNSNLDNMLNIKNINITTDNHF